MPWSSVEALASAKHWSDGQLIVKLAVGAWLPPPDDVIVIVRVAVAVAFCESFAVSVIVCVPTDSVAVEKLVPVPIWPSRLDVQTSDAPVSAPSSGSVAEPVNDTVV